ncbi:MAG: hypothetical protein JWO67_1672 [Streptosporangiaceae bacterium]|jgi:hypothetical protein|nr:hypothetical protein [Streptosporangiaceae bacterium]
MSERGSARKSVYEYALLRVVPSIERGEMVNVGVIVYCQLKDFLACRTEMAERRLLALDPELDLCGVRSSLEAVDSMCCGGEKAGQAAQEPLGSRFRWLTAPRSTIVQPGPVHAGLTHDPAAELDRLVDLLVR